MKTCKKCEERFARQQEIRNVRSNDVWPRFTASWCRDPRSTRSVRENSTSHGGRRKGGTATTTTATTMTTMTTKTTAATTSASCGGCACRKICRSTRRNPVVSFSENGESNNRCSGGDGAAGRSSVETISCRNCQIHGKPSDCTYDEKRANVEDARTKRSDGSARTVKRRSCRTRNFGKNDDLDLLYDRNCRTKNSVSFLINERDENSSPDDGDGYLDFPSKLDEWENRARDDSIEPATGSGRITVGDDEIANCDCTRKQGESSRSENQRDCRHQHRSRCHPTRHERERHESARHEDLLPKPAASRASSTKDSSRLCKDCALGQCPRNSAPVGRGDRDAEEQQQQQEEEEEEREGSRGVRADENACAIKHKDSMDLLAEKFKNKRTTGCSDDETIFKSDEDSASGTKINEKIIAEQANDEEDDCVEYDASQEEDEDRGTCCKMHGNAAHTKTGKFRSRQSSRKLKSRATRCCCCSSKEASCRHIL